jgi:pimeloyl-ACP methyl ester carboxylesterase
MPVTADIYYNLHQGGDPEKPPLVLIHGAGGNHLYWPAEIRRLGDYRVYALDLPGHGKSGGRGQQTIEAYTESILTWLEAIGLFRAVFVGHSMGGAIALTLAYNHTEHVVGLGLFATGARLRVSPLILENASNAVSFPAAVETITAYAFSSQADKRLVELASKRMLETRPSVLHGDFLACDAFDLIETVPEIDLPTLVLCGEDDQLTPLRFSQYLADQMSNTQLEVIPNAGHMVMLEKPQAVASALTEFLVNIDYRPGGSTSTQ